MVFGQGIGYALQGAVGIDKLVLEFVQEFLMVPFGYGNGLQFENFRIDLILDGLNGGFPYRKAPEDIGGIILRSEEHTSELQSRENRVCRLLHEKKSVQISQKSI